MAEEMFSWPTLQERITERRDQSRYDATDQIFILKHCHRMWPLVRTVVLTCIQIRIHDSMFWENIRRRKSTETCHF